MPTCRARRMCSRVCGMGPSVADTTRMAPSICGAQSKGHTSVDSKVDSKGRHDNQHQPLC